MMTAPPCTFRALKAWSAKASISSVLTSAKHSGESRHSTRRTESKRFIKRLLFRTDIAPDMPFPQKFLLMSYFS